MFIQTSSLSEQYIAVLANIKHEYLWLNRHNFTGKQISFVYNK
jgi:hypothetical protein